MYKTDEMTFSDRFVDYPDVFLSVNFDPERFVKADMTDEFIFINRIEGPQEINIIKAFVNIWVDGQVANAE